MYKTLENQGYQYPNCNQVSAISGLMPLGMNRLDNEGLKRERELSITHQKQVLEDYETLANSLWESLRFMRSQGFYTENSFQTSATQHLEQALATILLRKKDREASLEGYEAEHKKVSGNA